MKTVWEDDIIVEIRDRLVIEFDMDDNPPIELRAFFKKNPEEQAFYSLNADAPLGITHHFQNGISLKGNLTIQPFSRPHSEHSRGVFADLYFYLDGRSECIWQLEGFILTY